MTAIGEVIELERAPELVRAIVRSPYPADQLAIGASIAHAGCCLTLVSVTPDGAGSRHGVDIAAESLARTTLGRLEPGGRVNLERSLRLGDEMGGHLVTGHVDGVGRVLAREAVGPAVRFTIEAPSALAPLIAEKGSIAVEGVSLTVNAVDGDHFAVLIIPHTLEATTLGGLQEGDPVNLEADLLARYLARLQEARA